MIVIQVVMGNGENMEENFEESSHAMIYNGGVNQRKMLRFLG